MFMILSYILLLDVMYGIVNLLIWYKCDFVIFWFGMNPQHNPEFEKGVNRLFVSACINTILFNMALLLNII